MKKGFTLVEVLVAVMIVTILITMAVPMYERVVEKSRVAEVSMALKRLSEAKLRTMDNKNISVYGASNAFGMNQLDMDVPNSNDFDYSLYPASYPNAVCAKRKRGDNTGTVFLYLGETASEYCTCPNTGNSVCGAYCSEGRRLFCQNKSGTTSCDAYGLTSYSVGSCG